MSHPVSRRALGAVVVALLALAACGNGDPGGPATATSAPAPSAQPAATTPTSTEVAAGTIAVSFAGGVVEGGTRTETVAVGDPVRIEVTGDAEGEVHLHGYDLFADVAPGKPAVLELTADLPGVWEVELEGSHLLLLRRQVQ